MQLQAVLVDVGGTLWSERVWDARERLAAVRKQRLEGAGVPRSAIDTLTASLAERTHGADRLEYFDIREAVDAALAASPISISPEEIRRAMSLPAAGLIPVLPGARELLETVANLGLRCVILSNGIWRTAADYWTDFHGQGLDDLIHAVISSVDTCWRKPNRRIFETAVHAARAPAGACLMIGNSEAKDIVPAVELGIRTVRVAIEEAVPSRSQADLVGGSLAEVAQELPRMAAEV